MKAIKTTRICKGCAMLNKKTAGKKIKFVCACGKTPLECRVEAV